MSEPRCDNCGPYTPEQAAAIVCGTWRPETTGHLCERCKPVIAKLAQDLSNHIDKRATEEALRGAYGR